MGHQWYPNYSVHVPVTAPRLDNVDLQYRSLSADDIETVGALCRQWFPVDYPDVWVRDICSSARFFSRAAIVDDYIVGFIVAEVKSLSSVSKEEREMLSLALPSSYRMAYILILGVGVEYRRRGLASCLLCKLLCELRRPSYADTMAVYLHVLTSNSAALRFYERHLFRMCSFLPYFYIIDGQYRDGFVYVRYVNGGRASLGAGWLVDCAALLVRRLRRLLLRQLPSTAVAACRQLFATAVAWMPQLNTRVARRTVEIAYCS